MGAFGLLLAIALLILGTYNRIHVIPMSIVCSLVVVITSGLNVFEAIGTSYTTGFAGSYTSFLLVFMSSCLYSKLMETSGSAIKIANVILKLVGEKNVVTAMCIAGGLLCYGGVSGAVLGFLLVPIMARLFYQLNIPRKFMMTIIMFSNATWVNWIPSTTQMGNVILANFFGTKLTAGASIGLPCAAVAIVLSLLYTNWAVKKGQKNGEDFTFPPGLNAEMYKEAKDENLPSGIVAFLPFIVMVGMVLTCSNLFPNSTALTYTSILAGALVCFVCNYKRLKENGMEIKNLVQVGCQNGVLAVGNLAAVAGMSAVFKMSESYNAFTNALVAADMNVYLKSAVIAAMASLMAGSGMSGVNIVVQSIPDFLLNAGAPYPILHRVINMCALPFSCLPNCAAMYVQLGVIGLTQKETYKDTFIIAVVIGCIASGLGLAMAMLLY